MILFYVPGACSQAAHIALIETETPHTLMKVGEDRRTEDGRALRDITPKGYTPALELDDGTILTESLAILAFIAERAGQLLAAEGLDRWRALEATAFMTSEIHGAFKPLFYPDTTQAEKDKGRATLVTRFATLADQLGDRAFLVGDQMTIADPYLFVMLTWAARMQVPVPAPLTAYAARLKTRPSVAQALAAEGLA